MNDTGSALITLAQAGRIVNKAPATLLKWAAAGDGPPVLRFGKRNYVIESSFQRWWRDRTGTPMGQANGDGNRAAA